MSAREPPPRPPPWEERWSLRLLLAFAPRIDFAKSAPPPAEWAPFERVRVPRAGRRGALDAYVMPAAGEPRGTVLFVHPWIEWGQAYFHRRGRVEAVRAAGYDAVTFDGPAFGASDPWDGYWERDVVDVLRFVRSRSPSRPLHVWAVSSGAYWAQLALSTEPIDGAVFEEPTPHLVEWWDDAYASRWGRRAFRALAPRADRWLDLRHHLPSLGARRVLYVSGADDAGCPPGKVRAMAALAGGEALVVPGAGHLAAIKVTTGEIHRRALAAFADAEDRPRPAEVTDPRRPRRVR